jgi:hypothetical protein
MYCEYYKLYKIIVDYNAKTVKDSKITELTKVNNFPIYKDLEPFKEYKFEFVLEIHENILSLINSLMAVLNNKENELLEYKGKKNIGLNIDNFITSFNFNIVVMREEIQTFISYIEFFHKLHTKYLKRFSNKIQLMYSHINADIKFDETVKVNKNSHDEANGIVLNFHSDISEEGEKESSTHEYEASIESPRKNTSIVSSNADPAVGGNGTGGEVGHFGYKGIHIGKPKIKKMISKGVTGVMNMFMHKNNLRKTEDPMYSNDELHTIFSEINSSCDNIISNSPDEKYVVDNIGLSIDTPGDNTYSNAEIKRTSSFETSTISSNMEEKTPNRDRGTGSGGDSDMLSEDIVENGLINNTKDISDNVQITIEREHEPEVDADVEPEPEPEVDASQEPEPEQEQEPEVDAGQEPEQEPEPEPEPEPEQESEIKNNDTLDTTTEPKKKRNYKRKKT